MMFIWKRVESKFVGCLIGSAMGDALGNSFEDLRIFELKVEHEHFSGHWTDDTHTMIGVADRSSCGAVAYASSEIMRTHPLGREGAALQVYAVALAVREDLSSRLDVSAFLGKLKDLTRNEVHKEKLEMVERLFDEADKWRIVRGLGNGVKAHNSVFTAIYCFLRNSRSFEEAVRYAISLGEDTDTIGAMTSAISGAYRGAEAIPESWKSRLERGEYIETLAEKMWRIKIELFH